MDNGQQTETLTRDFQVLELVLNTPASHHRGIVTREHAMTRALLERQLAQRLLDARLDERYVRDSIEEAHSGALDAMSVAFRFHAAAIRDVMMPAGRPVFVHLAVHEGVCREKEQLRDRVDLLERRLAAGQRGVPYLPATIRFAPPPPSYEALETEESLLRLQLMRLHEELYGSVTSIWQMSAKALVQARQNNPRQRIMSPAVAIVDALNKTEMRDETLRAGIAEEATAQFSAIAEQAAAELSALLHKVFAEKEKYRLRYEALALAATEAAARSAMEEIVLAFTAELLADQKAEMLHKTELTRRLRNSLKEQHGQAMRHKKDLDVLLPPVTSRPGATKMSSIRQTRDLLPIPRDDEDAAIADNQRHNNKRDLAMARVQDVASAQHALLKCNVAEVRKAAALALAGGVGTGAAAAAGAGGNNSGGGAPLSANQPNRPTGRFLPSLPNQAESARKPAKERAPLYNAGFTKPYSWV